jgi:hypothetical protein
MAPYSIIALGSIAVASVVALALYFAWNRHTAFFNLLAAIVGATIGSSVALDFWFNATGQTSQIAYKAVGVWVGGSVGVATCTAVRFIVNPRKFALRRNYLSFLTLATLLAVAVSLATYLWQLQ